MIEGAVILTLTLIALAVASLTDIKTREVPDWLNYSLISIGLGLRLLYSVATFDFSFFLAGALGFAIFLLIGYAMFYTGQWGGGDSKLLMGIGALIGFEYSSNSLLLSFIVHLFLVGAVYGFIWSAYLAVKNRKEFSKKYNEILHSKPMPIIRAFVLALTFIFLIVVIAIKSPSSKILVFGGVVIGYLTFYLWIFIKTVENVCMLRHVTPLQLTEGEWIAEEIHINGKYIC